MYNDLDFLNDLNTGEINETIDLQQENNNVQSSDWHKNLNSIQEPIYLRDIKLNVVPPNTPFGFFNLIFKEKFYRFLINQVNKRIERAKEDTQNNSPNTSFLKEREMISIDEIKKYIAIVLFLGIVKQPNIKDYWLKDTSIYGNTFVLSLMGYNRFTLININLSLGSI
ncbi:hypothetical protein CDIK_3600 [Cucumispora dikerogammari]|nr:hypothetical protein CDIK_3600 [Cucumispora dikerogammari]